MKKKPSLRRLRNKLDKVFSEFIRRRDAKNEEGYGNCFTCGRWRKLESSHFVPRQHLATRWDPMNVHGACSYCNRWLHGNLAEYWVALVKLYGQGTPEGLLRLKRQTIKLTREHLQSMIELFK